MLKLGAVTVSYLEHDCFRVEAGGKVLYTDPFQIREQQKKADFVTISHEHSDHLSREDLGRVLKPSTVMVASESCRGKLDGIAKEVHYLKPGEAYRAGDLAFHAVPAYNTNKFRSPGRPFHPRDYNGIGFVIEVGGVRIYHAGDTDMVKEMETLGRIDLALLPVSGTYVMTADEAIEAAKRIAAGLAVPMHWGAIVGGHGDAERFVRGVSAFGKAELVEKE
jgi:L-ascorbate metabolism protein UlaG (beta-lactamase superfamily)